MALLPLLVILALLFVVLDMAGKVQSWTWGFLLCLVLLLSVGAPVLGIKL